MDKLRKIRKLYEEALNEENKYVEIFNKSTPEMGMLHEVALDKLHVMTERVETLKEVLSILEEST